MPLLLAASQSQFARLYVGLAIGLVALLAIFGVYRLLRRWEEGQAARRATPKLRRVKTEGEGSGMQIQFCRKSLERLGPNKESLLDALRERQHTPIVKDCLNRCIDCNGGLLM